MSEWRYTDPSYWETGGDDYADRCGSCGVVLVDLDV